MQPATRRPNYSYWKDPNESRIQRLECLEGFKGMTPGAKKAVKKCRKKMYFDPRVKTFQFSIFLNIL